MAETSKVLNPAKTVLIPDSQAGCSLAESITAADILPVEPTAHASGSFGDFSSRSTEPSSCQSGLGASPREVRTWKKPFTSFGPSPSAT